MGIFNRLACALVLIAFLGQAYATPVTWLVDSNGSVISPGWHNQFTALTIACWDPAGPCSSTHFNVNNAGTSTNAILDNVTGLGHHWTFDEIISGWIVKDGVGTADANTRYATFVSGHNGNAMLFSGQHPGDTDHIGTDLKPGIDNGIVGSGDVSVCTWISLRNIKPNYNPTDSNDLTARLNGRTGRILSNGVTVFYVTFGEQPNTYKLNETNNDPLAQYPSGSASEIRLNTWQHVCLTRSSTGVANFYVDGKPSGAINQTGGGTPTDQPNPNNPNKILHIGNQENFDLNKYFDGNMDDFRIYGKILTPQEISKIYYFGKTWINGGTIALNSDQIFKIDYYGTDSSDTNETINTAFYAIDTTPPTMTALNATIDTDDVHLTFSADDHNASGIKEYQVRLDSGGWIASLDANYAFYSLPNGTHTFYARAIDNANNVSGEISVVKNLTGADNTLPVIVLNGSSPMTISAGSTYVELGAVVTDNVDANAPATVTGTVNTNQAGTYVISYDGTDSSGNQAVQVNRTVYVVATGNPQADFNYAIDSANGRVVLTNRTLPVLGATITGYLWFNNGVQISNSVNYNYPTSANTDLNICLRAYYAGGQSGFMTVKCQAFNTGVWVPSNNPQADFNYAIDSANGRVVLTNTTVPVSGATITGYLWFNNNVQISNSVNYNYPTSANTDLNICLRAYYTGGTSGYVTIKCRAFNTGSWSAPNNPQADFNFLVDSANQQVVLTNKTLPVSGATITGYLWFNNGVQISNGINYNYPTSANVDLNICLRAYYTGGTSGYVTVKCQAFNTGVWVPPNNPQADFNYRVDPPNARVVLTNTTVPVSGATITGYLWFNNGVQISNLVNYNYPTAANTDLNICLRAYYAGGTSGYVTVKCRAFNTGPWSA